MIQHMKFSRMFQNSDCFESTQFFNPCQSFCDIMKTKTRGEIRYTVSASLSQNEEQSLNIIQFSDP